MKLFLSTLLAFIAISLNSIAQSCNHNITYYMGGGTSSPLSRYLQINTVTPYNNTAQSFSRVDWGDGDTTHILGSNSAPSYSYHNYSSPGTYYPIFTSITIDSNLNITCTDTLRDTLVITAPNNISCKSTIQVSRNSNNIKTVTFQAATPSGTSNKNYFWDFGDGSWSTGANAIHTYTNQGRYLVKLKINNNANTCSDSTQLYVDIVDTNNFCNSTSLTLLSNKDKNLAWFNFIPYPNISGFPFSNSGITLSTHWNYGDGNTTSININHYHGGPNHIYNATGTYQVSVILEWKTSPSATPFCIDTLYTSVQVSQINTVQSVYGYIKRDSLSFMKPLLPIYKVWLIKYDPSTSILSAIDSQIITQTSAFSPYYDFQNAPLNGTYRVKAATLNGPTTGTGLVPTYSSSALMWNLADSTPISTSSQYNYHRMDVMMRNGTITTGPGFVAGNVFQGANKGTSGGIGGMNVFITDNNDKVVQYAITDANGDYSFNNIPVGSYSIYPEHLGYITTPASINITNMNTSITGVGFERSHKNKTITPLPVSVISTKTQKDVFKIYPNPTTNIATIIARHSEATISITDIMGKKVLSIVTQSENTQLDLGNLQKGLYFVTVKTRNTQQTQKLLLQ